MGLDPVAVAAGRKCSAILFSNGAVMACGDGSSGATAGASNNPLTRVVPNSVVSPPAVRLIMGQGNTIGVVTIEGKLLLAGANDMRPWRGGGGCLSGVGGQVGEWGAGGSELYSRRATFAGERECTLFYLDWLMNALTYCPVTANAYWMRGTQTKCRVAPTTA